MSSRHIRGPLVFNTYLEHTGADAITVGNESVVLVNKTSGAATSCVLPAAASTDGRRAVLVVDAKADAATNNITVTVASGGTINGGANYVISENYGKMLFIDVGDEWQTALPGEVSAAEIAYLNGLTAGTATASKALVTNSSTEIHGILGMTLGAAEPTNPQALFAILPPANAAGVTANQSYFHGQILPGAAVTIPTGTAPVVASLNIHEPNITATGTVTDAATVRIVDAPTEGAANWSFWVDAGASRLDGTAYIGDTSNAKVTLGLTINQGAADDSILELKSSDVAHGVTTVTETDTYGLFRKFVAANGGLEILGLDDAATTGLALTAVAVTADATRSTAGVAPIMLKAQLKSGTGVATVGADKNILTVSDDGTVRFILDSDGDSFQDVGVAWTNFDDYDDAKLLTALSVGVSKEGDPVREHFSGVLDEYRPELEKAKLVQFNDDGHHFVNMSRLTMVLTGAVRQLSGQLAAAMGRLGDAEKKIALIGA